MPEGTHAFVVPVADAAHTLSKVVVPDADLIDVVGDTEAVIRLLRETVGLWKSELPAKATTARYRESGGRSAARSYNTDRILRRVGGSLNADTVQVIRYLLSRDALRLTWRWTELKAAFAAMDLPMTIASHEIEDGDLDTDVGEVWTDNTKVEAVPHDG